jgi:hypothetical protein
MKLVSSRIWESLTKGRGFLDDLVKQAKILLDAAAHSIKKTSRISMTCIVVAGGLALC